MALDELAWSQRYNMLQYFSDRSFQSSVAQPLRSSTGRSRNLSDESNIPLDRLTTLVKPTIAAVNLIALTRKVTLVLVPLLAGTAGGGLDFTCRRNLSRLHLGSVIMLQAAS
jgi:hypothetical protein